MGTAVGGKKKGPSADMAPVPAGGSASGRAVEPATKKKKCAKPAILEAGSLHMPVASTAEDDGDSSASAPASTKKKPKKAAVGVGLAPSLGGAMTHAMPTEGLAMAPRHRKSHAPSSYLLFCKARRPGTKSANPGAMLLPPSCRRGSAA